MNGEGLVVDRADWIKWWDALDVLLGEWVGVPDIARGLQMARACRHPDAQWLASLFRPGAVVTQDRLVAVMLEQGSDPRALFLLSKLEGDSELAERAAEMGFPPAQALMSLRAADDETALSWARKAAGQGDRSGLFQLGRRLHFGMACAADSWKGLDLCWEAALLGCPVAQDAYGRWAYGELDWERYFWCGFAIAQGVGVRTFCVAVLSLFDSFEMGQNARILFTVGPVIRADLNGAYSFIRVNRLNASELEKMSRIVRYYETMLGSARRAIFWWCLAARRGGVVKDIRLLISKAVWNEAYAWGVKPEKAKGIKTSPRSRMPGESSEKCALQ
jgi:hypothetical protein